jgi:hypothetical protein
MGECGGYSGYTRPSSLLGSGAATITDILSAASIEVRLNTILFIILILCSKLLIDGEGNLHIGVVLSFFRHTGCVIALDKSSIIPENQPVPAPQTYVTSLCILLFDAAGAPR